MSKALCDRCKREYDADAVEIFARNFTKEMICPDCESDMDYAEEEERGTPFRQDFNQ